MKELGTPNDYSVNLRPFLISNIRSCSQCLSDAGELSFRCEVIPVPSCAWLCIRLPDTVSKSHIGASHTGSRSSRLLYRIEILIPV